jgi:hypothetical protein
MLFLIRNLFNLISNAVELNYATVLLPCVVERVASRLLTKLVGLYYKVI